MTDSVYSLGVPWIDADEADDLQTVARYRYQRFNLKVLGASTIIAGLLCLLLCMLLAVPLVTHGSDIDLIICFMLMSGVAIAAGLWNFFVSGSFDCVSEVSLALLFLAAAAAPLSVCCGVIGSIEHPIAQATLFVTAFIAPHAVLSSLARFSICCRSGFRCRTTWQGRERLDEIVTSVIQTHACPEVIAFQARRGIVLLSWRVHLGPEAAVFVASNLIWKGIFVLVARKSEVSFVEESVGWSGDDVIRLQIGRHRLKARMAAHEFGKYQRWKHAGD